MKKFITIVMLVDNKPIEVTISSTDTLHEFEIYTMLEKMFPRYIRINTEVDDSVYQLGYDIEYKNELSSVAIYRVN